VTKNEEPKLPDLVPTRDDDFQIDARDIQPPRLKVASPTTGAAADGRVPNFCLFSEKGSEDDNPVVLVQPGSTEGIKVYILKMYKTWAANVDSSDWEVEKPKGGELRRWYQLEDAPAFVRQNEATGGSRYRQFNYVCYVPSSDDADLPHNVLLAKTSMPAARFINTLLGQRKEAGQPLYSQAFELWPEKRESERDGQTNRWAIFKARPAEATDEDVQAASALYNLVATKPRPNLDQDEAPSASGAPSI